MAKKNNDSVSGTAGEKIISMEARTSKETGSAAKAAMDKDVSMESGSSKEAGTAARATEGFNSPVKTETVAVSDIGASSEKSSKNDRPIRKKRNYLRLGKVAGVAGVCLLCVFAASMTSEANRNYWVRGFKYLTGNDTKVISDNDENNEIANVDEDKAIQDIEDKIGIKVPEFYYRPYGMLFLDYEISEVTFAAKMEYSYDNSVLTLMLDKQDENTASNMKSTHGDEDDEIIFNNKEGIEVTIKENVDESEEKANLEAQWMKNGTAYNFSGRIELEELKKMLEQMKF